LDAIRAKPRVGRVKTAVPRDSRAGAKEREAVLRIRHGRFETKRPSILNKIKRLKGAQGATVIYAQEEPQDESMEPAEWFLMTNEKADGVEGAYEKAAWYMRRRKAGQFHYALKYGCAVEKLQERSMDKTTVLVLMYSVIATFIMNITYMARINPRLPRSVCFEEDEWKAPYCAASKTRKPPEKPCATAEAVAYLSWLGGPRRAPGDGPPGVKAIWIGLEKLNTLLACKEWLA